MPIIKTVQFDVKKTSVVKAVDSKPNETQDDIKHLIGKSFGVLDHWKTKSGKECLHEGEIQIRHEGHVYVLNRSEYVVM